MYELISKVIKRIHTDPFIPQYYEALLWNGKTWFYTAGQLN